MKNHWCAAVLWAACGVASAQVYRCESGGRISYSDAPCGSGAIRSVEIGGNRVERVERVVAPVTAGVPATAGVPDAGLLPPQGPGPGACPGELDLRNIETRLSGQVVPAKNRAALYHERWKAQQCRVVGGRYGHEDWKRLEGVLRGED